MSYTKTTWENNTTPINETNLNKIESGIKNNDINIGEENYDNTKTYEVGDIVRYNEKIYKCITAITTAENFDISKWEQTNIVEIVQSEKSKIYELIEAISTPIVGEGENITLNDTAEKRFENFDIEGNSEQEATPSPDYPSEVKSCGDNINIFDKDNANIKNWYIDTNNKKIASGNSENRILIQEIKPNTTYTISKKLSTFIVATCINMPTLNSSATQTQRNDNATKIAIASGSSDKYLVVQFKTQVDTLTEQEILNSIKIVEGTETGEYSPYGQGCINEVICNKNLISIDDITRTDVGVTITKNGDTFVINGTVSDSKLLVFNPSKILKVLGDYTLSVKYVSGLKSGLSNFNLRDYETNSLLLNANLTTSDTSDTSDTSATITIESITQIKYGIYLVSGTTFTNYTFKVQLEKGTTATDYVEHQSQTYTIPTQQPMKSIGNVRDKFILKENGKWYERHYIARKIFDGTENWKKSSTYSGEFYINWSEFDRSGKHFSEFYCNYAKYVSTLAEYGNNIGVCFSDAACSIRTTDGSNINTVELWKAYLQAQYNAGTPVYVDYVLEEPLDIECTSEQTEILNQMYIKAKSYKGVTHIYSNDAVSPNCYVEAAKDLTILIQ